MACVPMLDSELESYTSAIARRQAGAGTPRPGYCLS